MGRRLQRAVRELRADDLNTYGALGSVIAFPVRLWISHIAILLGTEFNAELERGRHIEAGHRADKEPFIEPRDTRKMDTEPASR